MDDRRGRVAIAAGIVAGSIALVGFGLDSAIEGFASVIIIWRFTGHRVFSHVAEERAQKLVAVQFFLLAPYVAFESTKALAARDHPDVSWVGIGLAIGSVIFMPMLGIAKQRLADQLGRRRPRRGPPEGALRLFAGALLIGLLGNALGGAWWLDPAVALIAAVAVKEGIEVLARRGLLRVLAARRRRLRGRWLRRRLVRVIARTEPVGLAQGQSVCGSLRAA